MRRRHEAAHAWAGAGVAVSSMLLLSLLLLPQAPVSAFNFPFSSAARGRVMAPSTSLASSPYPGGPPGGGYMPPPGPPGGYVVRANKVALWCLPAGWLAGLLAGPRAPIRHAPRRSPGRLAKTLTWPFFFNAAAAGGAGAGGRL